MDRINLFRFFIALAIMPFILFSEALTSSHEAPTALPVVIMTHMKPPTHATGCWLNSIYKEAFQRLGYLMQYKHVPAAQAAAMTDHSESDGELGRTEYYGQSHPNVVRVDEPHLTVNFCVYTRKKPTQELDWQTLKETDGIIGHGRGIEKIALELNSLKGKNIYVVNSIGIGLRMLAEGRLAYFIGPEISVDFSMHVEQLTQKIHKAGVLESHSAHAYLNVRHKQLAIKLARTLKEMKTEGLLELNAVQCGLVY